MKLTLTVFMFCLAGVTASTYSQTTRLTVSLKNGTMVELIKQIESKSEYRFYYQTEELRDMDDLTLYAEDATVMEILNNVKKDFPLDYGILDHYIIIKKVEFIKNESFLNQENEIRGVVYDSKTNEPLIGAAVMIKDDKSRGAITNIDGEFKIECSVGETLVVSYMGFIPKELVVSNLKLYVIELEESVEELGEVVVTAFGTGQKKETMVGAVDQIKPMELRIPSSSLSSAFAGRMAGVIAVQRSGEPGADGSNFWIRGKSTFSGVTSALIILDGVEISSRELNSLDPEVIESFSILKDATATALYGTRGANGVMIITTKSGQDLDRPIINFRVEGSMSQLSSVAQMVDGVTYMHLYNEAVSRPGSGGLPYSEERIQGTIDRLNPYVYPNVNWYDEIFKQNAFSQRTNVNIRGGSKRTDYFMSAGLKHSDGNLRSISKNYFSYDNNINIYDYDFINNLNIKATPTTKVSLGLNLSVRDWNGPGQSANNIFAMTREATPVEFPILFPSDKSDYDFALWGDKPGGPYNFGHRNPMAEYVSSFRSTMSNIITANFKLTQDLDMLLKGLQFSGLFSYKNNTTANVNRSGAYNIFNVTSYDPETDDYEISLIGNERGTTLSTTGSHSGERRMYLQSILDYRQTFVEVHDLNIMFLYNHQQYNTNAPSDLYTSLPQRKQGIAGRLSYAFDNRYLTEFNFGYNGSENFAKGYRFGFFPSVAIGYNISQEDFWETLNPYISNFKLRASWGLVGNDQTGAGRFAYLEDLVLGGSPSYTTGVALDYTRSGPKWNRYYNPFLTWEVGEKVNLGMDLQFFRELNVNIDFFREVRSDIFMSRSGTLPTSMGTGSTLIYSNLGKVQNQGVDFSLDYNKQMNNNLFLSFKGTFTYAHNTILERDEPEFLQYPNLSVIGKSMNMHLAYIAKGLFPDQATIDESPTQALGYNPMPGDIWYENLPNYEGKLDNFIDGNDRVYMGYPTDPEIIYGFGPSIKYKNLDISIFFQGAARVSLMMSNFHPFGTITTRGVPEFIAKDRWTEDNQNLNAKYPRLTKEINQNNEVPSSYWLRDASFLKLKNAEIGYTYRRMRFYLSGLNLLTFSNFKHWDPEMGGGNGLKYPTQSVLNVGFQMTFK